MLRSFRPQIIVALLGMAVLIGVLLAGTVGSRASTPTPPASGSDTYVEAMVGAPRFVNPLLATSDTDIDLTHLVYSGLTRVDEQGNLAPDLASGWDVSQDSKVFTFTLRPNLLWQDGEPLTSDDIKFTTDWLQDPHFPGDPALAAAWKDAKIEVPTQDRVIIRLSASNSSFIQFTTLGILPRHLWAADVKDVASIQELI